jgi:hypothetical protein
VLHRWSPGASAGGATNPRKGLSGSLPLKRWEANTKSVRGGLSALRRWSTGASAGGATNP